MVNPEGNRLAVCLAPVIDPLRLTAGKTRVAIEEF
jgi:hypothetical protein